MSQSPHQVYTLQHRRLWIQKHQADTHPVEYVDVIDILAADILRVRSAEAVKRIVLFTFYFFSPPSSGGENRAVDLHSYTHFIVIVIPRRRPPEESLKNHCPCDAHRPGGPLVAVGLIDGRPLTPA